MSQSILFSKLTGGTQSAKGVTRQESEEIARFRDKLIEHQEIQYLTKQVSLFREKNFIEI